MKFADQVMRDLRDLGYTHCFFLAGGNIMHLLDAARTTMTCIPFVHEVSATIAAEYFNEFREPGDGKSFVLVTAGPGLTNAVTGIAGAFLENRELLVIGGQVKSSDLKSPDLRQRGIQEVDGVSIVAPICKTAVRCEKPISSAEFRSIVETSHLVRPGPVFIEVCLDAQAGAVPETDECIVMTSPSSPRASDDDFQTVRELLHSSERPVLLIGGGVPRWFRNELRLLLDTCQVPVMTTWNGADRLEHTHPRYLGRPNTWGQRSSNIIFQQSDLVIAVGTRLGMQQTGFNWQQFAPKARVVQVDIDVSELKKGHPDIFLGIVSDSVEFLRKLLQVPAKQWTGWISFAQHIRSVLPLSEPENNVNVGYINSYDFLLALSGYLNDGETIVPCSSGGAFTTFYQGFQQKRNQNIASDKSLASMGYGLAGAIGASLLRPNNRVTLVEGDGGFSQNLQELATVARNGLPIKMFIYSNQGYASIRMTQRNYFGGEYLGCDEATGLGFPDWELIAQAFRINFGVVGPNLFDDQQLKEVCESDEPALIVVPIDPEQNYYPKISSQVSPTGSMESAPLHLMTPKLPDAIEREVFKYL